MRVDAEVLAITTGVARGRCVLATGRSVPFEFPCGGAITSEAFLVLATDAARCAVVADLNARAHTVPVRFSFEVDDPEPMSLRRRGTIVEGHVGPGRGIVLAVDGREVFVPANRRGDVCVDVGDRDVEVTPMGRDTVRGTTTHPLPRRL